MCARRKAPGAHAESQQMSTGRTRVRGVTTKQRRELAKRDGLTDGTSAHLVEEMADVLICLWLLERMYGIRDRDSRTRHPSPVGACAALIKAVSKILRYGTEEERLDGLADAMGDVWRWLIRLEKENGITNEELDGMIEYKTNRQARRMHGASERKDPHHG